jgi:hypothetical protein
MSWLRRFSSFVVALTCLLAACSPAASTGSTLVPVTLHFNGERALAIETDFVQRFRYRHSGQPNNRLAAEWLQDEFERLGLTCALDEWQVVNYSRLVPLQNVVCTLPGQSSREILLVAHFDQSPDTIQGADNDGSGISILLALAEVFAAEPQRAHTLRFVATDGEEYGMLGTRRYMQTHPDTTQIIAGVSLDNLGKEFYTGLDIDPRGQYRHYGALWLQRLAQDAARASGEAWVPQIDGPLDQVLSQAVPISFMDEGPIVAHGVPAFGLAGIVAAGYGESHWNTYHTPGDTLDIQSAVPLEHAGRATEALVHQLMTMQTFPSETGPYLYFEDSGQVLRGLPLWAIFTAFVGLFAVGAALAWRRVPSEAAAGWHTAVAHWLGLWLPLVASVVLLYVFVAVGLMDKYAVYPGTAKDNPLFEPRWPAVILWLLALPLLFWAGRRLAARLRGSAPEATKAQIRALALGLVALGGLYVLLSNPFSLLFMVPLLAWLLIGQHRGWGRALDIALFLLGGLVVYVLFYFFGFLILRNDWAVLWYLMMMFSIGMVSFATAVVVAGLLAAGLALIVAVPVAPTFCGRLVAAPGLATK